MFALKTIMSLIAALTAGALIWVFLGELLRSFTSNIFVVGGLNGVAAIIGGVVVNVVAEKFLGISGEADV